MIKIEQGEEIEHSLRCYAIPKDFPMALAALMKRAEDEQIIPSSVFFSPPLQTEKLFHQIKLPKETLALLQLVDKWQITLWGDKRELW